MGNKDRRESTVAVRQWKEALKLLGLIEAQSAAAAQRDQTRVGQAASQLQKGTPTDDLSMLLVSYPLEPGDLVDPVPTWERLLQHKVPLEVLQACCRLVARGVTRTALFTAAHLVACAAHNLTEPSASSSSSGSNSGTSSSTSTSTNSNTSTASKLLAVMRAQLQQSGFLQHLPGLISSTTQLLQADIETGRLSDSGLLFSREVMKIRPGLEVINPTLPKERPTANILLQLLFGLCILQPAFFTTHAAGQLCLVPAMQLGMLSLQFISKVVPKKAAGSKEWMQNWISTVFKLSTKTAEAVLCLADSTILGCRHRTHLQVCVCSADTYAAASGGSSTDSSSGSDQASRKGRRGHSSSGGGGNVGSDSSGSVGCASSSSGITDLRALAAAVLFEEQTLQCLCLSPAVNTLVPLIRARLSTGIPAPFAYPVVVTERNASKASASDADEACWRLLAFLAPHLPAAHKNMFELLGCSREVGVWATSILIRASTSTSDAQFWDCTMRQLQDFSILREAQAALLDTIGSSSDSNYGPATPAVAARLAGLSLAVPALTLQWMLDLPAACWARMPARNAAFHTTACSQALAALQHGQKLAMHSAVVPQPQPELAVRVAVAVQAAELQRAVCNVFSVCVPVLQRLLGMCRALQGVGHPAAQASHKAEPQRAATGSANTAGCDSSSGRRLPTPASSGSSSSSSSSTLKAQAQQQLLQSSQYVMLLLSAAVEHLDSKVGELLLLMGAAAQPVFTANCYRVLQDFVRVTAEASATGSADSAAQLSAPDVLQCCEALQGICRLLGAPDSASVLPAYAACGVLVRSVDDSAVASEASRPADSQPALHLLGLLVSLMKATGSASAGELGNHIAPDTGIPLGLQCSIAVSDAVCAVLSAAMDVDASMLHPTASASAAAVPQLNEPPKLAAGSSLLPWLALLGRCCLEVAAWLHGSTTSSSEQDATGASAVAAQPGAALATDCRAVTGSSPPAIISLNSQRAAVSGVSRMCRELLALLQQLTTAGAARQQLGAAGTAGKQPAAEGSYGLQHVLAQLHLEVTALDQETSAVLQAPTAAGEHGITARSLPQNLVHSVQKLGTTLTCLAFPQACNNADCKNVSGPSEAQLVGGRSCVCGSCRAARFCCPECQVQSWAQHKPVCRALQALQPGCTSSTIK